MTAPEKRPFTAMREEFRAAAAREMRPEPRRRTHRRFVVALLAAIGVTGSVAAATQLISIGEPRREPVEKSDRFKPEVAGIIAVTAPDPDRTLPWGVLIYRAADGERCALAGQLRGTQLGAIEGDRFRPFEDRSSGICARSDRSPYHADVRFIDGRSVVYGRARAGVVALEAAYTNGRRRAPTGVGGAFLFVFDGQLRPRDLRLRAVDAAGRTIG